MLATNQSMQRSFNRSTILQTIKCEGPLSRADLARKLGIEKSTVSPIVNDLVEQGILLQRGEQGLVSNVGRRPVFLELNKDFCCFLGIEIQPNKYRAVVVDLNGDILYRFAGRASVCSQGIESSLGDIYESLIPVMESLHIPLAAIGIGMPGYINPHTGLVIESIPFDLRGRNLAELSNPWSVPTFIENDANCCAWAELLKSSSGGGDDFIAMLIEFQERNPLVEQEAGISIGLGVVVNSDLYYGESFAAGEFHSLFWKKGNKSQTGISDERLAMVKDDPGVFDDVLEEVLLNLTPVVSVIAPQRIVLCGDAARANERMQDLISRTLSSTWLADPANSDLFAISQYAHDVAAIGSAARIIVTLFKGLGRLNAPEHGVFDWSYVLDNFSHATELKVGAA